MSLLYVVFVACLWLVPARRDKGNLYVMYLMSTRYPVTLTQAITKHGVCMHSKHMHSSLASARRAKIVPPTHPQDI